MMSEIKLDVLCIGSIVRDGKKVVEAHSSSVLVRSGDMTIVVDTSSPERRDHIRYSLRDLKVEPKDVDAVVLTHMHDDHTGNINLFPRARRIAHAGDSPPKGWEAIEEEMEIAPGVRLVPTPGHSYGSLSVFVDADRRYVIAGDALPTIDNYMRMVPPGINYDPELATESIKRIVEYADVVVPGHGPPFSVR